MKNFKNVFLLFALTAIISSGCSEKVDNISDLTDEKNERVIASESKEWFIDMEKALSIANQFMSDHQGIEMRSSEDFEKTLKSTSVIKSKEKVRNGRKERDILMYVFNYTKGFTVVSGSNDIYPILAYSDIFTKKIRHDETTNRF